jgi:hypothetical protein
MNARKMLGVLTIGGIIVLAGPPRGAKAVSPIDPNPFLASFEKMTTEVSRAVTLGIANGVIAAAGIHSTAVATSGGAGISWTEPYIPRAG